MKKIVYFLGFLTLLTGCDSYTCVEAKIINESDKDLILQFYHDTLNIRFDIDSKKEYEIDVLGSGCSIANSGELYLNFYDSIIVKSKDDKILKVWKQDSSGRNIYDFENQWLMTSEGKYNFYYTFEILNSDFN